MNTGEKIDYMIQCLKVAKAEYEYMADYVANQPTEHRPVLPIVKRDIPPGFRHYQKAPANHAFEMCGGSGRQRREKFANV